MVGREKETSEPGDRRQGQVSPEEGRATTPALTTVCIAERSAPLDWGSAGQHTSSHQCERREATCSHPCVRDVWGFDHHLQQSN